MSELEKFALQGGGVVSQTMSKIPCPRAESAPQVLAYTHTPYHWLLAMAGLYFSPQDGRMQIHGQTNISAADNNHPPDQTCEGYPSRNIPDSPQVLDASTHPDEDSGEGVGDQR